MKKHFYFVSILIILCIQGYAQPQYSFTQSPAAYNTIPFQNSTNLRQWLYYPSNFPGMPVGQITKLYIKAETAVSPSFALLTIKMGTTSLNNFTPGPFVGGLTTVYQGAFAASSLAGNWVEITLQTPFFYDSLQNFVLECSQVGYSPGFRVMQTNGNVIGRSLLGYATSSTGSTQDVVAQIGFQIQAQTSPLSVKLNELNAVRENTNNILSWTTSEETDIDRYEIERSSDGISFENIGSVYAHSPASEENQYQFTDRANPAAGVMGKIYYRLLMVDLNEKGTHSATVSLKISEQSNLFNMTAAPVPFSRNLSVSVNVPSEQPLYLTVRDVTGKVLLLKQQQLSPGLSNIPLPDLDQYSQGIYFLTGNIPGNQQTLRVLKY